MGLTPSKPSHVLLFMFVLPALSIGLAWIVSSSAAAVLGTDRAFLFDSVGVIGAYGLLFALFDRHLWTLDIFRSLGVVDVPVLRGRWTGTIVSSYAAATEVSAYLEVVQTFSSIQVSLYSPDSRSASLLAGFVQNSTGAIELHYEYRNEPLVGTADTMHDHPGMASLRWHPIGPELVGSYYNRARDGRGHTGRLRFRFVGRSLMQAFE